MNVEKLYPFWFILCASAGAAVGSLTGHGALRGLTDGMIVAALPLFLLILAHLLLMRWRPDLPPCRCRQCTSRGYSYVGGADGQQPAGPIRFKCPRCGRVYAFSRGRFDELGDDGRTIPYMHHSKWGRWKETQAGETPSGDATERDAPGERG